MWESWLKDFIKNQGIDVGGVRFVLRACIPSMSRNFLVGVAGVFAAGAGIATAESPGEYWLHYFQLNSWEWEIDHDGDGLSARAEYFLGENPFQPKPLFSFDFRIEEDESFVVWDTVPGVRYQLEHSVGGLMAWGDLGAEVEGDGTLIETIVPATAPREFFRV